MAPGEWRKNDDHHHRGNLPREKSAKQDREDILSLNSLREIPKTRYATKVAITQMPSGRGRSTVFSHIEVYKMVENIATELRESGVRPGTICAMAIPNSVDAIVYFLALQWIGAVAAPFDANLEEADIKDILIQVQASTLVSPLVEEEIRDQDTVFSKLKTVADELNLTYWNIWRSTNKGVQLEQHGRRAGEGAAWKGGSGDFKLDSAEICVRLGSIPSRDESSPRGKSSLVVPLSHQNITTAAKMFAKLYELSPESNTTIMTDPLSSVHGIVVTVGALYTGGHIVIPGNDKQLEGFDLINIAKNIKVDWFSASASLIADMYTSAISHPEEIKNMHLSFIRCHEGCLSKELHASIESLFQTQILTTYGTPESCGMITTGTKSQNTPGCAGKAIPGVSFVVLDPETKQKCPNGVSGDIAVASDMFFTGYLNNPQANERCRVTLTDENGEEVTYFLTNERGAVDEEGRLSVAENSRQIRAAERSLALLKETQKAAEEKRLSEERLERERKEKEEEERRNRLDQERAAQLEAEQIKAEKMEAERLEAERIEAEKQQEERMRGIAEDTGGNYSDDDTSSSNNLGSDIGEKGYAADELKHSDSIQRSNSDMAHMMGMMRAGSAAMDPEAMSRILEKLMSIEDNQRRMEEELKQKHTKEMAEMARLLDEAKESNRIAAISRSTAPDPLVMQVNMDEINSAVNAASLAAQDSSRHTAEAAEAAKAAALAAQEAAACKQVVPVVDPNAAKVEVSDPTNVQKTVVVSLDEVEEAMLVHPAVAVCRAFGRPDPRFGNEVFCAVLPKKGARVSEPWLKLHAQSVLPAACVPKKFFYHPDLKPDTERRDLSTDRDLKRVSHLAGYSSTKMVKAPSWSPDEQKRAAA